jgi:hypothetical protein
MVGVKVTQASLCLFVLPKNYRNNAALMKKSLINGIQDPLEERQIQIAIDLNATPFG